MMTGAVLSAVAGCCGSPQRPADGTPSAHGYETPSGEVRTYWTPSRGGAR